MKRNRIIRIIVMIILLCAVLTVGISAIVCRFALTVRPYELPIAGLRQSFTAVCISDLHSMEFGKDNARLLEKIRSQQPDVIFSLGDLINRDASDAEVQDMCAFLKALEEIAPVYASLGNHEEDYMKKTGTDLRPLIRDTDVTLLDEQCCVAPIAGNRICLGGTLGHLYPFGRTHEEYLASPEYLLMTEMQESEYPTVVLSHRPDTIIFVHAYKNWDIDLFLSGHTHGGVIRVPFAGGVFAPMQGFFPEYDRGFFRLERIRLIISGGFAGYKWVPRVFNLPEVTVLHFEPTES